MYQDRPQSQPGSRKPTQQAYGAGRTMHHISFDYPSVNTLRQALEILSGEDKVSIGLVVRRALRVYAESLLRNPEAYREAEREAIRQGARVARSQSASSK
jgi:hypothetical protein